MRRSCSPTWIIDFTSRDVDATQHRRVGQPVCPAYADRYWIAADYRGICLAIATDFDPRLNLVIAIDNPSAFAGIYGIYVSPADPFILLDDVFNLLTVYIKSIVGPLCLGAKLNAVDRECAKFKH